MHLTLDLNTILNVVIAAIVVENLRQARKTNGSIRTLKQWARDVAGHCRGLHGVPAPSLDKEE